MNKPLLLDLFCGAGGCAVGYARAGFDVIGVDHKPQPNYPYRFIKWDALKYLAVNGNRFAAIHASPPCQAYTVLNGLNGAINYPDLVAPVRALLRSFNKPYVIENVPGAPLYDPIMLCGRMFRLHVYRHRLFESNFPIPQPMHAKHILRASGNRPGDYAYKMRAPILTVTGGGNYPIDRGRIAMGIDWMVGKELTQAIPPAYTEYVGKYLLETVLKDR